MASENFDREDFSELDDMLAEETLFRQVEKYRAHSDVSESAVEPVKASPALEQAVENFPPARVSESRVDKEQTFGSVQTETTQEGSYVSEIPVIKSIFDNNPDFGKPPVSKFRSRVSFVWPVPRFSNLVLLIALITSAVFINWLAAMGVLFASLAVAVLQSSTVATRFTSYTLAAVAGVTVWALLSFF